MQKFAANGIETNPAQSIRDVVMLTGVDENILLGIIFLDQ